MKKLPLSLSKRSVFSALAFLPLAVLVAIPQLARANVLVNGDFESEPNWGNNTGGCFSDPNCTALTGAQLPGWTIESGHAVTIHNTNYPTISGAYSVNTDGEGFNRNNANFYQDFASVSGQQYDLQYDWMTWFQNTAPNLDVSVIDTVTSTVLYHGNFAWNSGLHHEDAVFAGTGDALRLRVQESPQTGVNDNAYIVDNFSVNAVVVGVPEPETYALMLGGLAALGFVARRRKV